MGPKVSNMQAQLCHISTLDGFSMGYAASDIAEWPSDRFV